MPNLTQAPLRRLTNIGLGLLVAIALACALVVVFGPGWLDRHMNGVTPLLATDRPLTAEARALHQTLFIADLHADSLLWNRDLNQRNDSGQLDFPRLQAGNVALQMFTTVTKTPAGLNYHRNDRDARDNVTLLALAQAWPTRTWSNLTERALYQADKLRHFVRRNPQQAMLITSRQDLAILQARRQAGAAVVGAMLGTEGSHALSGRLENIERLYRAGFRMMSLQHFFDNALGGSLHGQSNAGLTEFGRAAVKEMNRLGIVIDVAHSSPQVVKDTLALSTSPLVVSHTGIQGQCTSPRNIADDLMQDIASRGGLIAIGFWRGAVCDDTPGGIAKSLRAAVDLLGEDAVALGSDYDGAVTVRFDASELALLTQALLTEGMAPAVIAKVMGGNQRRFFTAHLPRQ